MAYQTSTNHYQNTKYVVSSAGNTPYATVQSAITAANTAGIPAVVYIRPGTYTENLTLYTDIFLEGTESIDTIIVGHHTPPAAGTLSFTRVCFTATGNDSVISSAAAGTTDIKFTRCRFVVNNGYICNLVNWTGAITLRYCNEGASANNGVITNATGTSVITLSNSIIGTGTGNTMSVIGALDFFSVKLGCPLTINGAAASFIEGGSTLLGTITTGGTANLKIRNSTISTGAAIAITIGSAVPMLLNNVVVDSTNALAISGTGTVNFNEATFPNSKALAGTIVEGLTGVVKTGEIYANTVLRMDMSGFYSWAAGGPYFDDTTLGTFQLLVGGTGYIKGRLVTWVAQNIAGMTSGATWYIYIDSTGTIGKTSTRTDALFVNNIVLFECLYDETPVTKQQHTVKENHAYNYPVSVSNYEHDVIGSVIDNVQGGANITLVGAANVKISISGDDVLADHGLDTTIPDSAGAGVVFKRFYTTAGGKWAVQNTTDTFAGYYNNAGTPTALGANRFCIYRLYVSKDTLNATTPTYYAILDITTYGSAGAANTAISNNTPAAATNELASLELAQLGFIVWRQSTAQISSVVISKATLRGTVSLGTTNVAALVSTDVTSFNGILSAADTNVQAALDTIDNWGASTTNHAVILGRGTGVALGALSIGTTGQILTGVSTNDPTWTTATYPADVNKGDVLVASADHVIGIQVGATTAGYVLMANGAATAPTFQALPSGGLVWSIKTSDLNPMVVDNGYIANKAGLLTFTLPTTCAVGKTLRVTGMNTATGWRIAQNANQIIHFGTSTTTTGASGHIDSTQIHDSVELVCCVTDLEFIVVSTTGNITVV